MDIGKASKYLEVLGEARAWPPSKNEYATSNYALSPGLPCKHVQLLTTNGNNRQVLLLAIRASHGERLLGVVQIKTKHDVITVSDNTFVQCQARMVPVLT